MAEGTPAAVVLDEAERIKPLRAAFVETFPDGRIMDYDSGSDSIEIKTEDVSLMLRAERRSVKELLANPILLERYALAIAPFFVHEATHARQIRFFARQEVMHNGFIQQAMEIEAYSVQGAFVRIISQRSPKALATIRALQSHPELDRLIAGWTLSTPPSKHVANVNHSVRAADRAWIDSVETERARLDALPRLHMIAELARRRRLPAAERLSLERNGEDQGVISLVKTSALRRLVALADRSSRTLTLAVTATNDEIMANARRALRTFHSLRGRISPEKSFSSSRTTGPAKPLDGSGP